MLAGLLSGMAGATGALAAPVDGGAAPGRRVVALDWSLVEVALAIGITPIAASEASGYRQWVQVPRLPPAVADLGLRMQPNFELLQMLDPTLLVTIPERNDIATELRRIAPLESLPIYSKAFTPYTNACAVTRRLGELTGREAAAHAAVDRAETAIEAARRQLPADLPPVLVIRFVDARNLFVFGAGGLFDEVMKRMGIRNAWHAPPSYWGFSPVSLLALANVDPRSRVFITSPALPPDVVAMMRSDPLWHAMPFVQRKAVTKLPAVWFFGATEAAARFATLLAKGLAEPGRAVVPEAG